MVTVGAPAPNVTLTTVGGQSVSLAETWQRGQYMLLVFLRHLG